MALLVETNFSDVETITESIDGKKQWFIEGVFAQSGIVNKNRRRYPSQILDESMNVYDKHYVSKNRAVGEAEHPNSGKINIDRISHLILPGTLSKHSNDWSGKAKILNTPCGNTVKGLLEGGVQIGVSTRASGSVSKTSDGILEVAEGLEMKAIDIVFSPSAPDALVAGLMENDGFVWDSISELDKELLEDIKSHIRQTKKDNLKEEQIKAFTQIMEVIRNGTK